MGVDIHIRICKYNKEDNLFHELAIYRKEEAGYIKISPFEGRNSELFEILGDEEDFPHADLLLDSLEDNLKKDIKEDMDWCYGFYEITFSDMKCYLKDYPTVVDYDADWECWEQGGPKPQKENPVSWFFKDILSYTEFAEGWTFGFEPLSRYKLLYWFDH